jgi:hypothetical protein
MRTLQEKYNGVLEGKFSKTQFKRDAAIEMPQFVSTVNSFDDTVAILKNKGAITEAKKQEPKYSTAKPADTIAPDVLDTGIKFELDKKYGTLDVTPEQYAKCREMAIKNLSKDVLYYVKQDSIQLDAPGEKMEKAKLNEGFLDRFKKKPAQSSTAPLSAEDIQAMIDKEAKTGTIGDILDAAVVQQTIDLRNATPEQIKTFVSVAREADAGGDTVTGDNSMSYLKKLPNYGSIEEAGMLEGMSKEEAEAWKEFQAKHNVTDKTIKAARKDFEDEWKKKTNEVKVEKTFSDGRKELASDGKEMTRKEAEDFIKRAKAHGATPMNTTFKIVNETVDRPTALAAVRSALKGKYEKLEDRDIAEFLQVHLNDFMGEDPDVDITDREAIVDNFENYIYHNEDSGDIQDMIQRIGFFPNDVEQLEEESVEENALGFSDIAKFGSEAESKIDIAVRGDSRYTFGNKPHVDDQLRYEYAKKFKYINEADIKLSAEDMEKLHKDGKLTLPNGSVLHFVGKADDKYLAAKKQRERKKTDIGDKVISTKAPYRSIKEEREALKEMFKKIITKVIND